MGKRIFTEEQRKRRNEYNKKYRKDNKEILAEKQKEYREDNKEILAEKQKEYYENNKEVIIEKNKKYRDNNKEILAEKRKEYRKDNKDTIAEYHKEYRRNNKNKLAEKKKDRYKNDNLYVLTCKIRKTITKCFQKNKHKKSGKTVEILGCDFSFFKEYIENQFEPWMTWENRGLYNGELNYGWDLDHIIPISSAKTEEDVIKLNHYTNFQPLCSKVNRDIKMDKIEY